LAFKRIKSIFRPAQFQGWGKSHSYFEGWYFKVVDREEHHAMAIIPGIAMDREGNRQAFIQVLDGVSRTAAFHRYELNEFSARSDCFEIAIGNNNFSEKGLQVDVPGVKGSLTFQGNVPWPNRWFAPGIMGPYTFAPLMECYHGIVSMDHEISGRLDVDGKQVDFGGGRGYIEKDWGRSFPSAYFWMQSNHFSEPGTSLKAAVAKIPWVTGSFTGFLAGLWHRGELFSFTTYNGTKLLKSEASESKVELVMENRLHRLEMLAHRDHATGLASPIHGYMEGRIEESMTSALEVSLFRTGSSELLFRDRGRNAGLEVAGNIREIIT